MASKHWLLPLTRTCDKFLNLSSRFTGTWYHVSLELERVHVIQVVAPWPGLTLDLRRGYATSFPPSQVTRNDSNKGSNGPAGSRSGKLHSERGMGSA